MIVLPLLLDGASNIGSLTKGTKRKLFNKRALIQYSALGLCYIHAEHLHPLSFTIDNAAYIRVNRHSHIDCLTSVIYTGQVGCSHGRPLFRSYGPVGYSVVVSGHLCSLNLCSHQLCLPCILYFIRHSPRISEVSDLVKGFGTLTCLQDFFGRSNS